MVKHLLTIRNSNVLLCTVCVIVTFLLTFLISVHSSDKALDNTRSSGSNALANTLSTGQRALENTVEAYVDAATQNARVAQENLLDRTAAQMGDVEERVAAFVHSFLGTVRKRVEEGIHMFNSHTAAETTSWEWLFKQRAMMWSIMRTHVGSMVAFGFTDFTGKALWSVEDDYTVKNPVLKDGKDHLRHVITTLMNDGTDLEEGTVICTAVPFDGACYGDSRYPSLFDTFPINKYQTVDFSTSLIKNLSGSVWNTEMSSTFQSYVAGDIPGICKIDPRVAPQDDTGAPDPNGQLTRSKDGVMEIVTRDEECDPDSLAGRAGLGVGGNRLIGLNPLTQDMTTLASVLVPLSGNPVGWSPLVEVENYIGFIIGGPWYDKMADDGVPLGSFWGGLDLRGLSVFLGSLQLGSDVSRAFLTVARDWGYELVGSLVGSNTTGVLAGVSHGSAWKYMPEAGFIGGGERVELMLPKKVYAEEATDDYVRGLVKWVNANGGFAGVHAKRVETDKMVEAAVLVEPAETQPPPGYMRDGLKYDDPRASKTEAAPIEEATTIVYFLSCRRITDDVGLDMWFTFAIDRESILGEVERKKEQMRKVTEENNARVAAQVETEQAETAQAVADEDQKVKDDVATDRIVLIIVCAIIVIVLIITCVVFVSFIVRPLKKLGKEMNQVGTMHLDDVDEKQQLSRLHEVRGMQKSFLRMLRNMKELRNYMPQSLMVGDDDDQEEEELVEAADGDRSQMSASAKSGRQSRHSKAGGSRAASRHKMAAGSIATSASHTSAASQAMKKYLAKVAGEGTKKKKVTFVVTNCCGWHPKTLKMPDTDMCGLHTDILDCFLNVAAQEKGVVETFSGDRVICNFNAVKPLSVHRSAAVRFGTRCRGDLPAIRNNQMSITVGCCSGDSQCGNIGCAGMKKFSVLGTMVSSAFAFERHAKVMGATVLMDHIVFEDAKNSFVARRIGQITMTKRTPKPLQCIEAMDLKKVSEDEWMYQLEEGDKAGAIYEKWDNAVKCWVNGEAAEGAQIIQSIQDSADRDKVMTGGIGAAFAAAAAEGRIPDNIAVVMIYH